AEERQPRERACAADRQRRRRPGRLAAAAARALDHAAAAAGAAAAAAVARPEDDLELVVAVDVADRGRRDDPLPGELGPPRRLDAAAVERVDEVAAGAGDDLG